MNAIELLIIYLACGASFGVYYFLHNRARSRPVLLWLKSIFVFFLWLPFAVFHLRQNKNLKINSREFGKTPTAKTERAEILHSIQKQIEKILVESDLKISIYEFREIVERYVGLTLANQSAAAQTVRREAEIYRVAQAKNVELGSICFRRRNRKRLSFHQTEARKDFLRFIEKLSEVVADQNKLAGSCFEIVQNLNDPEARKQIENIYAAPRQTEQRQSVKRIEEDLWKPEETRQPQPAKSALIYLPSIGAATTNLRRKD